MKQNQRNRNTLLLKAGKRTTSFSKSLAENFSNYDLLERKIAKRSQMLGEASGDMTKHVSAHYTVLSASYL